MNKRLLPLGLLLALTMSGCTPTEQEVKVTGVNLAQESITIWTGETSQLSATINPDNATNKNVSWSSSQPSFASIDDNGLVTGLSEGSAVITVTTADGGFTDTCQVTVNKTIDITDFSLTVDSWEMSVGDSKQIGAVILPENATNKKVNWTSSNEDVATVSLGKVTALKVGTTTITATTVSGGFTATCDITVKKKETSSLWDDSQDVYRYGTQVLDFFNFNDLHGTVASSESDKEPGICLLSSYLKQKKAQNPGGFVLTSSGDMWQGSADSNITRGGLVADWMNYLGFDAMGIGNHEFDWTIDVINGNQEKMNFPLLACNIIQESNNEPVDWVEPYTTITKNGVHIGIVGAIGKGQTGDILASNVEGLTFADPNSYINKWSKYLKDNGADIVLVLLHDGITKLSALGAQYADVMFGGHNHITQQNNNPSSYGYTSTYYDIPGIQAGKNGMNVGHTQLTYNFSTSTVSCNSSVVEDTRYQTISYLGEDSETRQIYDDYLENEINAIKNEVVSPYTGGISSSLIPNIYNQYAYRYFKENLDVEDEYTITAVETNNARASIPSGKSITYGDIYKALPFDNNLVLVAFDGKYISRFMSYQSAHWYIPGMNGERDGSEVSALCHSGTKVYMLMVDYIAIGDYYSDFIEIVHIFYEEECLPRNLLKRYLNGYPSNVTTR